MTFDVNVLVMNVAKEDKGVVLTIVGDEGQFVLGSALLDDGCPDVLCCNGGCPDDHLLRDVEVEDIELDYQSCLLCNSMLCTCC